MSSGAQASVASFPPYPLGRDGRRDAVRCRKASLAVALRGLCIGARAQLVCILLLGEDYSCVLELCVWGACGTWKPLSLSC
jgi:hypothetical protein